MTKCKIALCAMMLVGSATAVEILNESFEAPTATGYEKIAATGWVLGDKVTVVGLVSNVTAGVTGGQGAQVAWFKEYNGVGSMETTSSILSTNLEAGTFYTLTFNAAGSSGHILAADLIAGTTVLATKEVSPTTKNLDDKVGTLEFIALPDHPNVGEALAVRVRMIHGTWNGYDYIDNVTLDATGTSDDVTPPTPGTLLWGAVPVANENSTIMMQAATASDTNLVQYCFTNTVNGQTSGWQSNPLWIDTDLTSDTSYNYKYKVRDMSANLNEIPGWSSEESAMIDQWTVLYDSFEVPTSSTLDYPYGWGSRIIATYDTVAIPLISTPYGNRAADTHYEDNTLPTYLTNVLSASYTYELTYNVCRRNTSTSTTGHGVELYAGSTVVASVFGTVTSTDMSHTDGFVFVAPDTHEEMGELLKLRLQNSGSVSGGDWRSHSYYDNLRLRILSPAPTAPSGTVIILK